jgi:hypothetical protein
MTTNDSKDLSAECLALLANFRDLLSTAPAESKPSAAAINHPFDPHLGILQQALKRSYEPEHVHMEFDIGFNDCLAGHARNPYGADDESAEIWQRGYLAAQTWKSLLRLICDA